MLLDEDMAQSLRPAGRFEVTLTGLDDRPLHEDVPGHGEACRVPEGGLLREAPNHLADVLEVSRLCAGDLVAVGSVELEEHVDERAPLEVLLMEPLVEEVEDGQELFLGGVPSPLGLGLNPFPGPALLPLLEEREDEVVLGGEVPVDLALEASAPAIPLVPLPFHLPGRIRSDDDEK